MRVLILDEPFLHVHRWLPRTPNLEHSLTYGHQEEVLKSLVRSKVQPKQTISAISLPFHCTMVYKIAGLLLTAATALQPSRTTRSAGPATLKAAKATSADADVVVVTHAAGRMGASLCAQLHESWEREGTPNWASHDKLVIRAVVRDENEATRLKIDLGGCVIKDKQAQPLVDTSDWLDVTVVEEGAGEAAGLAAALQGASTAVFCAAAHAGFEACASTSEAPAVVPGSLARARAESSFSHVDGINVRVPRNEAESASRRLLAEVNAIESEAKETASVLRHVVLRSSMGVGSLEGVKGATSVSDVDVLSLARMGGEENIRAIACAEEALKKACEAQVGTTIIRLGALTDDSGGVPLAFGRDDQMLRECVVDGGGCAEPPLVSRNDAARLLGEVVRRGLPSLDQVTFDAAWSPKFGVVSAGTPETAATAARQDVVAAAAKVLA